MDCTVVMSFGYWIITIKSQNVTWVLHLHLHECNSVCVHVCVCVRVCVFSGFISEMTSTVPRHIKNVKVNTVFVLQNSCTYLHQDTKAPELFISNNCFDGLSLLLSVL